MADRGVRGSTDDLFAGLRDVDADALATKSGLELAYDGRKDPS